MCMCHIQFSISKVLEYRIRHLGTVGHPHEVWDGVLVTKVVGMLTTNLNDANVTGVQDCTLILFPVIYALFAINVCIKGRVCYTELRMMSDEVLGHCLLVKGDNYTELPQSPQVIHEVALLVGANVTEYVLSL